MGQWAHEVQTDGTSNKGCARQGRQPLIFVVDDEKVLASTLEMILTRMGFSVRTFVDPVEALRAAESCAPDILLVDVVMPEMSGIELAGEMKRLSPACKVLFFSGEIATGELLLEARSRGYDFEVLPKPVHPNILVGVINKMVTK